MSKSIFIVEWSLNHFVTVDKRIDKFILNISKVNFGIVASQGEIPLLLTSSFTYSELLILSAW